MFHRLSLNGDIHVVEADGDTPLLWVLRDLLGMTSPHFAFVPGDARSSDVRESTSRPQACWCSRLSHILHAGGGVHPYPRGTAIRLTFTAPFYCSGFAFNL
jgi:aerobic-type carbon monoxide dehydrogenase small subunit (CoxS/CutS family)